MASFHLLSCSGCCGNEDVNIFTELLWTVSQVDQCTTPGAVIHIDRNINEALCHNLGSPESRPSDKDLRVRVYLESGENNRAGRWGSDTRKKEDS